MVASRTFQKLDAWMFRREIRYAKHTHPGKSWAWLRHRYWGKLDKTRRDVWVFGNKHTGRYLHKFRWFNIVRHILVRGKSSQDDPSLREYWWKRQRVNAHHLSIGDVKLASDQDWRCPICGEDLINGEELHRHHWVPRSEGGSDSYSNRVLVHLYCHQQIHAKMKRGTC